MKRLGCVLAVVGGLVLASAFAAGAQAKTVWLCLPGHRPDPCAPGLSTTVYSPRLTATGVEHPRAVARPGIDCFYVYPTVSDQTTGNANLDIDPEERSIALFQAARYSQYCRVFAPMYRQLTLVGIPGLGSAATTPGDPLIAYADVVGAFDAYLHRYNHGRGFVLIGHSQGSFLLRALISRTIDPNRTLRRRLVSAILLGGNVVVARGKRVGGDFKHISGCRSATQLGCVIAFSTFDATPPANTLFGIPVDNSLKPLNDPRLQVLCTNPAALGGGAGLLDPIVPGAAFAAGTLLGIANELVGIPFPHPPTVWWTAPGAYSGSCQTAGGATVLEIAPRGGAPTPTPVPNAQWGLHILDANIALGNLVGIVAREARAFRARGR